MRRLIWFSRSAALPYGQLDRASAALLGASLMAGVGALTLDQAYRGNSSFGAPLTVATILLGLWRL